MLRVGLTGGLGSGKSTVARMLRDCGAEVIEADELGRSLMEPNAKTQSKTGKNVFAQIVDHFGSQVVLDGRLNRARLAEIAFGEGRLQELNAIVHPAVIDAQAEWMRSLVALRPDAIAIVESALIFEVERDAMARGEQAGLLAEWRRRFDRIVVVTASEDIRIARFVARHSPNRWNEAIAADARARIALQISESEKIARADFVIENTGDEAKLKIAAEQLWRQLVTCSSH